MFLLICSTQVGGCGFAGTSEEFALVNNDVVCLKCKAAGKDSRDTVLMLKRDNFLLVTDDANSVVALELLHQKDEADGVLAAQGS